MLAGVIVAAPTDTVADPIASAEEILDGAIVTAPAATTVVP